MVSDELKQLIKEMVCFLSVGVINTIIGTAVMFSAYNLLGLGYWLSSVLNYTIGGIFSYILNRKITFKAHGNRVVEIAKFVLIILVCYLIAYGLARPLAQYLLDGIDSIIQDNIAMLVGMVFYTGLNYLFQKFFVFK